MMLWIYVLRRIGLSFIRIWSSQFQVERDGQPANSAHATRR